MAEPKPLTAFQQSYHWRNKNCGAWAHKWVKDVLPGLKLEEGGAVVEMVEVTSVSGDCDLGQRKGKLLTIYDLDIEAKWTGTTAGGDEVSGTLHVPEFSHEVLDGLSEYNFQFALTSTSVPGADAVLASVRKSLPAILIAKFDTFRPALLEAHGIFSDASPGVSGASTPANYAPAPPAKEEKAASSPAPTPAPAVAAAKPSGSKVGNTKTVEVSAQLQASADDIWGLLTDQARIPMWSRSAAKFEAKAGGQYELFGGNVRGEVREVDAPKKLVQSWATRNGQWPADHFGTLTTTLAQGSDSTTLTLTLDGVPTGQASDIERALDTFYIRGLKQMGLVSSSTTRSFSSPLARHATAAPSRSSPRAKPKAKTKKRAAGPAGAGSGGGAGWLSGIGTGQVIGAGAVLGLSALFVGLVVSSVNRSSGMIS